MATKLDIPSKSELQKAYSEFKTIRGVAQNYFVSTTTITRWFEYHNIGTTFEQRVSDYQFIQAYTSGTHVKELTKRWGCSKDIIWHRASKLKCRRPTKNELRGK